MAACHLIANGYLSLLRNVYAHQFVHAGGKFVLVFAGEYLHVHYNAAFAVGHAQGGIPHLSCLFAEYGAQQALFRGQLGFALGRYLADQYVAASYLCADADYAALVKVAERVLANVGYVAGYFFLAQLGVAGFGFMLLYMYGCVYVVLNQLFAYKYGVLVVVTLPGHETYQYVAAKGYFAVLGACAVRQHVAYLHLVAHVHYGALVDAGALVGTLELDEFICMANAACILGHYLIGCNVDNRCILVRNYHNAGIVRSLVFHAGANHGRFWHEQRNRLALHVRSH